MFKSFFKSPKVSFMG